MATLRLINEQYGLINLWIILMMNSKPNWALLQELQFQTI